MWEQTLRLHVDIIITIIHCCSLFPAWLLSCFSYWLCVLKMVSDQRNLQTSAEIFLVMFEWKLLLYFRASQNSCFDFSVLECLVLNQLLNSGPCEIFSARLKNSSVLDAVFTSSPHPLASWALFLMPAHELVAFLGSLVSEIRSRSAVCTLVSLGKCICASRFCLHGFEQWCHSIFSLSDPHAWEIKLYHKFTTFTLFTLAAVLHFCTCCKHDTWKSHSVREDLVYLQQRLIIQQ